LLERTDATYARGGRLGNMTVVVEEDVRGTLGGWAGSRELFADVALWLRMLRQQSRVHGGGGLWTIEIEK